MQKGMQILHPFLVVHLAAHVSNTNIRRFVSAATASASVVVSAERSISTAGEKKNDPDNRIASTSVIC